MSVRYLFNTSGQYVAFIQGTNLFSPDCDWLGFTKDGVTFYDTGGVYLGQLSNDDRLLRPKSGVRPRNILPPYTPYRPYRPYAPLPRWGMLPPPLGMVDVFESRLVTGSTRNLSYLDKLKGSELYASDSTFLGLVSKSNFDDKSMGNRFGPHGSRYSQVSIFNPYSPYGSKFNTLSPFNDYSIAPPSFQKDGYRLGYLTVNSRVRDRIDPEDFFLWFEQL